jgi:hypothetical protein
MSVAIKFLKKYRDFPFKQIITQLASVCIEHLRIIDSTYCFDISLRVFCQSEEKQQKQQKGCTFCCKC